MKRTGQYLDGHAGRARSRARGPKLLRELRRWRRVFEMPELEAWVEPAKALLLVAVGYRIVDTVPLGNTMDETAARALHFLAMEPGVVLASRLGQSLMAAGVL